MLTLAIISIAFAAAAAVLVLRLRRGRGSSQFVFGLLPLALLLAVAPIPGRIEELVFAFKRVFEGAGGSVPQAAAQFTGNLLFGTAAALTALVFAGLLQKGLATHDKIPAQAPARGFVWGREWILLGSTLLVLAVLFLTPLLSQIPRGMVQGLQGEANAHFAEQAQENAHQAWLLMTSSMVLSGVLGLVGLVNLTIVGWKPRSSPRLKELSWFALAFAVTVLIRIAIQLNADTHLLEQTAQQLGGS